MEGAGVGRRKCWLTRPSTQGQGSDGAGKRRRGLDTRAHQVCVPGSSHDPFSPASSFLSWPWRTRATETD